MKILLALLLAGGQSIPGGTMYHEGWTDFNKNGRMDVYENPAAPLQDRIEDFLGQMMSHLSVVVEKYPEFHFDEIALQDRKDTKEYEENVRLARMVYNDTATKLNRMIRQWPSSFVASMLGFKDRDYFTLDRAEKRDVPIDQL